MKSVICHSGVRNSRPDNPHHGRQKSKVTSLTVLRLET